jgi:general secretion pathway protein J
MRVHSKGFTLLEMLLAITLIGIMLVLIGSALTSSRHTLEMTDRYVSRLTEVRAAQDFMRQALQQALPLALSHESQPKDNVLTGSDQTIRFVAPLPRSLKGGLQTHSMALERSDTGTQDLIVTFTPISPANAQPWGEPQHLLENVRSIRLAYRGLDNAQVPTGWIATWLWPDRLPNYVRVEMEIEGPVQWPTLTVALRSNLDSSSAAAQ